jgi:3-deoxy-D-manno-octulosonic-acid transferase
MLRELQNEHITTILISGIFRKDQLFFKKTGAWYRESLKSFKHFFVQDEDSVSLLRGIGFTNVTKSGDTRFDRVFDLIQQRKELPFIQQFKQGKHTLVAGSTWPKDEDLLLEYINNHASENEKFIIAPHNISAHGIANLVNKIQPKSLLYSTANLENVLETKVLIIDSIGILTSVYYYGDVAYVGGGFGVGIHNILEPATYGIPIIIGPNYQKFKEAVDLIDIDACFEIDRTEALKMQLQEFTQNEKLLKKSGEKAFNYIKNNTGATEEISQFITEILK